jgi:hypothetical protein
MLPRAEPTPIVSRFRGHARAIWTCRGGIRGRLRCPTDRRPGYKSEQGDDRVFGLERDRLTPKSIALFTSLFCRMIFSEKSATFRDHALGLVSIRVRRAQPPKSVGDASHRLLRHSGQQLDHFPAKWIPVRRQKMRPLKEEERIPIRAERNSL